MLISWHVFEHLKSTVEWANLSLFPADSRQHKPCKISGSKSTNGDAYKNYINGGKKNVNKGGFGMLVYK